MKVFVDTNVLVDVLLGREPFCEDSGEILSMAEYGEITLYTTVMSLVNCLYICRKTIGYEKSIKSLKQMRRLVSISPLTNVEFDKAIAKKSNDLEDANQYYSAVAVGCDMIISRDKKGFTFASIPVYTPNEFLCNYD